MRARANDPARTTEAKAKMGRANALRVAEARDWERTHERPDQSEWEAIFVGLAGVSVRAIERATGLSPATCWRISEARGDRMHGAGRLSDCLAKQRTERVFWSLRAAQAGWGSPDDQEESAIGIGATVRDRVRRRLNRRAPSRA